MMRRHAALIVRTAILASLIVLLELGCRAGFIDSLTVIPPSEMIASMLDQTPHQTSALALETTGCVEVSRDDIAVLLQRKPLAGMDMLTVLGHQFHASQQLVRIRANRNANAVIEEEYTFA